MLLFSSSASLLVGRAPPQRAAGIALRAPPVMSAGDDVARTFPGDESYVLEKLLDDDKDAALDIDVQGVVEEIDPKGTDDETDAGFDSAVIIIGAGASGIGTAISLTDVFGLAASRIMILERGETIGKSFRSWPEEMKFISPSFNQAGWTKSFDLNSVAYGSSPSYTLHAQHPSGHQYADYLDDLASMAGVRDQVQLRTEVLKVEPDPDYPGGVFNVQVRAGQEDGTKVTTTYKTKYVVWAAGEFQYPREGTDCVGGAELCVHNSRVKSWAELPGDERVVIGGYESGVDAAYNLAKAGKAATVLASTATWNVMIPDPSMELAPYTAERLREVTTGGFSPKPKLMAPLRVRRVEEAKGGGYNVVAEWKAPEKEKVLVTGLKRVTPPSETGDEGNELVVHTAQPPILATGFEGSVAAAAPDLFHLADDADVASGCCAGAPKLTREDESTKVPGVFLVGPAVTHGKLSFCFVYKFRQRFGIVADAICRGLGRDTTAAREEARKMNMFLELDEAMACCTGTCDDSC